MADDTPQTLPNVDAPLNSSADPIPPTPLANSGDTAIPASPPAAFPLPPIEMVTETSPQSEVVEPFQLKPPKPEELAVAEAKAKALLEGKDPDSIKPEDIKVPPVPTDTSLPPVGGKKIPIKAIASVTVALFVMMVMGGGLLFSLRQTSDIALTTENRPLAADSQVDGKCPDDRTAQRCVTYRCEADLNNDGQCNPADDGNVAVEPGDSDSCVYIGSCGQADIYAGGDDSSFCGTQGHDMSGCGGGGGDGGGGGEPCTESETCPGKDASGNTVVCGPTEDCIVRDRPSEDTNTWIWGCKTDKGCVEDTPNPSHEPPEGLVCKNLRANPESPQIGETARFICRSDGTKKVDHFEFRYRIGRGSDKGEWQDLPSGTAEAIEGEEKQFRGVSDLTIAQAGDYKVQCRVCKRADGNCTDWGKKN